MIDNVMRIIDNFNELFNKRSPFIIDHNEEINGLDVEIRNYMSMLCSWVAFVLVCFMFGIIIDINITSQYMPYVIKICISIVFLFYMLMIDKTIATMAQRLKMIMVISISAGILVGYAFGIMGESSAILILLVLIEMLNIFVCLACAFKLVKTRIEIYTIPIIICPLVTTILHIFTISLFHNVATIYHIMIYIVMVTFYIAVSLKIHRTIEDYYEDYRDMPDHIIGLCTDIVKFILVSYVLFT
jgi:hypothetical protein